MKISDISKWFMDSNKLLDDNYFLNKENNDYSIENINIRYIFEGCTSLSSLPDISKWDTKNVTNMSFIFCGCKSLFSLPDISEWDTKNVTYMSYMFDGVNKKLIPKKFQG